MADLRRALGPVGAFVGMPEASPRMEDQRAGVLRLERAGYRAVWTNETVGADALVRASLWLAASDRLIIGTCIANMWVRPTQTAHAAATQLNQAYPGRFVLGLGVGYPAQAANVGREFGSPLTTAREYLEYERDPSFPRILAANGPKMLALARELADGALPAGSSPAFTAQARESLGADELLVVYVPIRAADTPTAVAGTLAEHLGAGADHVVLGMSYNTAFTVAIECLHNLAPTIAR
jgi:probable F420-dependent oxidoreductase